MGGKGDGVFLSTPSARRATCPPSTYYILNKFLSTPSARRATSVAKILSDSFQHFYPRPPRGGRQRFRPLRSYPQAISIHALREEGDALPMAAACAAAISIHALREEGDPPALWYTRRAYRISIHALREEGDDPKRHRQRQTV